MDERVPMTLLTSVSGSFAAHVLSARLQTEGIDAELRGAVDGPYPFTVGRMAEVTVYVPADQLDDARLVLLADEVETAFDDSHPAPRHGWRAVDVVLAAAVLVVLFAVVVVRATQTG